MEIQIKKWPLLYGGKWHVAFKCSDTTDIIVEANVQGKKIVPTVALAKSPKYGMTSITSLHTYAIPPFPTEEAADKYITRVKKDVEAALAGLRANVAPVIIAEFKNESEDAIAVPSAWWKDKSAFTLYPTTTVGANTWTVVA